MGIANIRHIVSYAALCLLAIASFSKQPVKAVGVTLLISVLVEVEQALFTAGHARIRDLVPNVIAVCLAALIWFGAKRMLRTRRGIDDSPAAD